MPKFYFTIADNAVLDDSEGTELPDLEAAWEHARTVASELMHRREGMLGHPWDEWTMIVKNEKGDEVFSFRVAETVDGPKP
jgi:hypothetical protein